MVFCAASSNTVSGHVTSTPHCRSHVCLSSRRWIAPRQRLQTQTQKHSSTFTSQVCRAELKVGDSIKDNPDYYRVLKRSDGGGIALSNFENKKPVVIFFYPKAATPGCTKQACKFRDEYGKFKDAGAEVFGISADTPDENAKFAKDQKLPFPLLSDQSDLLRKSFGIKADMFGMLKGRQTYVLDKKGKCVLSFNSQLDTDKHVSEALRVIASVT